MRTNGGSKTRNATTDRLKVRANPEPSSSDVLSRPPGLIEILLPRNVTLRVDAQVDGPALRRVLAALSGR